LLCDPLCFIDRVTPAIDSSQEAHFSAFLRCPVCYITLLLTLQLFNVLLTHPAPLGAFCSERPF
jgi:hypothetical protein